PFNPYFEDSSFLVGSYFIFSLRIDKKKIPAQLLKKKLDQEIKKRLKETGQEFIAKGLKQRIKEQITEILLMKIDPTPSVYDLIWDYENEDLYFYSTQKAANEELETLFAKTFGFTLINLFPFTIAELDLDLNTMEKEKLHNLLPFIIEA
ncbi:MAG: recombination-associated protein RdgC, partial [Desulfobacterales bacterium]|nr:recombination-associated protein RdgC [Desulfobacterales bacterium]